MTTYFVCSGAGATAAPYDTWNKAAVSMTALLAGAAVAGTDVIYVHNTHSANAGAAITWTLPETGTGLVKVICVDGGDAAFTSGGASMGSTVGSITTGGTETTGGNNAFTVQTSASGASLYVHGINFTAGAAGNSANADITLGSGGAGKHTFSSCTFWTNSTNAGALLTLGGATAQSLEFRNCVFKFGAAGQWIVLGPNQIKMFNCSLAGTAPTTLFSGVTGGRSVWFYAHACDFSASTNVVSSALVIEPGEMRFSNCAIGTPVTGTHAGPSGLELRFEACNAVDGTNGANILAYYYEDMFGNVQDSQTVYKATGGSQGEQDDGTDTSYSFKLTPNAACWAGGILWSPWVYQLVGSTGDKTVTMKVAHTETAVLKDIELIGQIDYMGEPGLAGTQRVANSPHTQVEYDDAAPLCTGTLALDVTAAGSNRTDDAIDDWTGLTSEKEHTITWSVNCAEVGYIRCRVGVGKQTTNPVYVDGKITVA